MPNMRPALLAFTLLVALCCVAAEPAAAQMAPGSIGNAGRMPETMSPGALPPPPMPQAMPVQPPPAPYPNTQSMARDRVQSQGYAVRKVEPRPDGSWRVDATRGAVPTRPQGYPRSITIHPDGRETVEY
jgi:hypothetical protein